MNMVDFRKVLERAISETVRVFLENPLQFHGGTGISHFFYHRVLTHGGRDLFHQGGPDSIRTLLFQSEQLTEMQYRRKGKKDGHGRLDFAFIDPQSVGLNGSVPAHGSIQLGSEIGFDKALHDMGDMGAGLDATGVRPGDAAKLIRELRFAGMRSGFLLQFYSSAKSSPQKATQLFEGIREKCRVLHIEGLNIVAVYGEEGRALVSTSPVELKSRLGLDEYGVLSASGELGDGHRSYDATHEDSYRRRVPMVPWDKFPESLRRDSTALAQRIEKKTAPWAICKPYNGSISFEVDGKTVGKFIPENPQCPNHLVGFSDVVDGVQDFAEQLGECEPYEYGVGKEPFLGVVADPITHGAEIVELMASFLEHVRDLPRQ